MKENRKIWAFLFLKEKKWYNKVIYHNNDDGEDILRGSGSQKTPSNMPIREFCYYWLFRHYESSGGEWPLVHCVGRHRLTFIT